MGSYVSTDFQIKDGWEFDIGADGDFIIATPMQSARQIVESILTTDKHVFKHMHERAAGIRRFFGKQLTIELIEELKLEITQCLARFFFTEDFTITIVLDPTNLASNILIILVEIVAVFSGSTKKIAVLSRLDINNGIYSIEEETTETVGE